MTSTSAGPVARAASSGRVAPLEGLHGWVVVRVHADGVNVCCVTRLSQLRHYTTAGVRVPVAAVWCDPALFCRLTGLDRLPVEMSFNTGAKLFGRTRFAPEFAPIVQRLCRESSDTTGLLVAWHQAVVDAAS